MVIRGKVRNAKHIEGYCRTGSKTGDELYQTEIQVICQWHIMQVGTCGHSNGPVMEYPAVLNDPLDQGVIKQGVALQTIEGNGEISIPQAVA